MTHTEEMQEVQRTLQRPRRPASARTKKLVVWFFASGALVAGLSIFAYAILDFAPYQNISYAIDPTVVCPSEATDIIYEANIRRPPLGDIKRGDNAAFDTSSQWVNADTGRRLGVESDKGTFTGRYGYRKTMSNFQRFAPNEPGRWRIEASITTHGWQALQPATQVLEGIQTEAITVREFDAPECAPRNL